MMGLSIFSIYIGTGCAFLYKFAQAMLGKEDLRKRNMILSAFFLTICTLIHEIVRILAL